MVHGPPGDHTLKNSTLTLTFSISNVVYKVPNEKLKQILGGISSDDTCSGYVCYRGYTVVTRAVVTRAVVTGTVVTCATGVTYAVVTCAVVTCATGYALGLH